jgi:hypothetical protein
MSRSRAAGKDYRKDDVPPLMRKSMAHLGLAGHSARRYLPNPSFLGRPRRSRRENIPYARFIMIIRQALLRQSELLFN